MKQAWQDVISEHLGVQLWEKQRLVSAKTGTACTGQNPQAGAHEKDLSTNLSR